MPFTDINLEMLFIFNKFLNKKLSSINNPIPFNVLEDVDMDSYKVVDKWASEILLVGEGELLPALDSAPNYNPDEKTRLSEIIKSLNDTFGTEFSENNKLFLKQVKDNILSNEDLVNKIANNSKENIEAVFDKYFEKEMNGILESNFELFKRVTDNLKMNEHLKTALLGLVYKEKVS